MFKKETITCLDRYTLYNVSVFSQEDLEVHLPQERYSSGRILKRYRIYLPTYDNGAMLPYEYVVVLEKVSNFMGTSCGITTAQLDHVRELGRQHDVEVKVTRSWDEMVCSHNGQRIRLDVDATPHASIKAGDVVQVSAKVLRDINQEYSSEEHHQDVLDLITSHSSNHGFER